MNGFKIEHILGSLTMLSMCKCNIEVKNQNIFSKLKFLYLSPEICMSR